MNDVQTKIDKILSETQTLRDELIVQMNLGKSEAKEELAELDGKYELYKQKSKEIVDVAGDTAAELRIAAELGLDSSKDIGAAIELAAEELKAGFERIKNIV